MSGPAKATTTRRPRRSGKALDGVPLRAHLQFRTSVDVASAVRDACSRRRTTPSAWLDAAAREKLAREHGSGKED